MFTITVLVALGKTEIDNVDGVPCMFSSTNEEIVRLNITMDNPFIMYFLDVSYQLNSNHKHRLKIKLAFALLE